MEETRAPFFSIGVTTYDRVGMLIETLRSILGQTFSDYEVIVSNDNPSRNISADSLGIHDARVRFVNQAKNLGERLNMNFLLNESRGKYFTWLADDDLYHPHFLEKVHAAIIKFDFPVCVFNSYNTGHLSPEMDNSAAGDEHVFTGQDFLQSYLSKTLRTQGCYGIFDIQYLRQIGGMRQLGKGFSYKSNNLPGNGFVPYSDNLLIIQSGLLDKVLFIDAPLIFFRTHERSASLTSGDIDAYASAQQDLCQEFIDMFYSRWPRITFRRNLSLLLGWCIADFAVVAFRAGSMSRKQLVDYADFLNKYRRLLGNPVLYIKLEAFLIRIAVKSVFNFSWNKIKLSLKKLT